MSMAEIAKLSLEEQTAMFAHRARRSAVSFIEMGKLHHQISANLPTGRTIYNELRALGVKDSTISNASYASKVWDMVAARAIPESTFDTFTFADCLAIVRVTGPKSAKRLTAVEVAQLIIDSPDTWDKDLDAIYESGLTVAQAEAKAEAEQTAREEAAAKAQVNAVVQPPVAAATAKVTPDPAPTTRVSPAEQTRIARESLDREWTVKPPVPQAPVTPVNQVNTVNTVTPPAPPKAHAVPQAPVVQPPPPENVVQMPPKPPSDELLPEILDSIDQLSEIVQDMSEENRKAIFAKLNDLMAIIGESLAA